MKFLLILMPSVDIFSQSYYTETGLIIDVTDEFRKEAESMTIKHNIARNSYIFSAARSSLHERD